MLYKFSEKIYYTKHRFTYLEPSIGYVKGKNFSIMIDAGNSKEQVETFFNDLKEYNLPLPMYVILTHHHWDHSFGSIYTNLPVISSSKTSDYLSEMAKWNWDEYSLSERIANNIDTKYSVDILKKVYPNINDINIKIPDIKKYGDFSMNLGDLVVYFYSNDNSHSDDSLLIYIKSEKLLFLGDSHSKSYKTIPLSFDKTKLYNYINFIKDINFDYAIPGHGNIMTKHDLVSYLENEYSKI
ncbi:MBL fold metallo-hydrolase [Gemella sp. GH3]|uniref:MBL fold metallo-hydrolase n=1 Tax=unclassified Gemella TaxID=2624949 RepID=UPI0015CFFDD2|nr:MULTISPECIES: MBL fold metallo-hydrolase [unclassified Gemella]MBF0713911.1 MBL fold metallo-hydrolase [Gemella sp. GH3.1]NYS50863.1 MBL fold metallo-hydrolase [Gemella sp. GH3]